MKSLASAVQTVSTTWYRVSVLLSWGTGRRIGNRSRSENSGYNSGPHTWPSAWCTHRTSEHPDCRAPTANMWFSRSVMGQRICISDEFPGDVLAAGPRLQKHPVRSLVLDCSGFDSSSTCLVLFVSFSLVKWEGWQSPRDCCEEWHKESSSPSTNT